MSRSKRKKEATVRQPEPTDREPLPPAFLSAVRDARDKLSQLKGHLKLHTTLDKQGRRVVHKRPRAERMIRLAELAAEASLSCLELLWRESAAALPEQVSMLVEEALSTLGCRSAGTEPTRHWLWTAEAMGKVVRVGAKIRPPCEWELLVHALGCLELALGQMDPAAHEEAAGSLAENQDISHASDFSWLLAYGRRFDFQTPRQREVIRVLFRAWNAGGDGAGMTEAAILEELGAPIARLRVKRAFKGHPAMDQILKPIGKGQWALFLAPPGNRTPD